MCRPTSTTPLGRDVEYNGEYLWVPTNTLHVLDTTPPELPALVDACATYAANLDTSS